MIVSSLVGAHRERRGVLGMVQGVTFGTYSLVAVCPVQQLAGNMPELPLVSCLLSHGEFPLGFLVSISEHRSRE